MPRSTKFSELNFQDGRPFRKQFEDLSTYLLCFNDSENNIDPVGMGIWDACKKHYNKTMSCLDAANAWEKQCKSEVPDCDKSKGDTWDYIECLTKQQEGMEKCAKQSNNMFKKCMGAVWTIP